MVDRPLSEAERAELLRKGLGHVARGEPPEPIFTWSQAVRELVRPAGLEDRMRRWEHRYDRDFARTVMALRHTYLPGVTPTMVDEALAASSHALGELTREVNVDPVKSANPPWALTYLFHEVLETDHAVPTWDRYRVVLTGALAERWYAPVLAEARAAGLSDAEAHRAIQWRTANAWQGCMRKVSVLATLRDTHGLPVAYHQLADVNLKVDMWMDRCVVRLVMPSRYEQHKDTSMAAFERAGFRVLEIEHRGRGDGYLWLPHASIVDALADQLVGGAP